MILLIHGGAKSSSSSQTNDPELKIICDHAFAVLRKQGSAVDAVTFAVELLEDNAKYNAGLGSKIQSDGVIRMSASLMDGESQKFASCVNVQNVKNPVALARNLLNYHDRVLEGIGAERFAKDIGLDFRSPYTEARRLQYERHMSGETGTVGAVALDSRGRLAAATSTGGRGFEYPYRVSDTPTVAGNFANRLCAVSATGVGEEIVDHAVAATLCAFMKVGLSLKKSAELICEDARLNRARFGFIALDSEGHSVVATSVSDYHVNWSQCW